MKYIRTKYGVYEVVQANDIYTEIKGKTNGVPLNDGNTAIHFKEILKQSENLDELCDGFYIDVDLNVERNFEYAFHHFEHFAKTMKSFRTTGKVMVKRLGGGYGYIRTDKCLLYVAKLNDNGELVLI